MDSPRNMSLAILDCAGGVLKLSGQHEEMIVVRADGKFECIDTMDLGFPIGLVEEIGEFIASSQVQLNPGMWWCFILMEFLKLSILIKGSTD